MDYLKRMQAVDRAVLLGGICENQNNANFNWAWLERNGLGELKVGISLVTPDYPDLQLLLRKENKDEVDLIIPEHNFGYCQYEGTILLNSGLGRINRYKLVR